MNTNRKKEPSIFGPLMIYIGATTILLLALLPYVIPQHFAPLPTFASFIIVAFALFCYVYVTMCLSLMKVHKKTLEVSNYAEL